MKKSIVKRACALILALCTALSCGIACFAEGLAEATTDAIPPVIAGASGNLGFWLGIGLFVCASGIAGAVVFLRLKRENGEV